MRRKSLCFTVAAGAAVFSGWFTRASGQEFPYKGQTVRIVVGFSPGGGFDAYSRTIARHLGKHLPGRPAVIVENMTGAGSLVAANHVFKAARPDGLTIGNINGGIFVQQLLGWPGIEFDATKYEHVGVPVRDKSVCVMTKSSGFTTLEQWMASKSPLKLGATGPGSATHNVPLILKEALNLPIQLVSGYKGIADVRLAAEGNELAGVCGWTWDSLKATWGRALDSGDAVVVLQTVAKPIAELPKVPLAINAAKTAEARQLIQAGIHDVSDLTYAYVLPPGTPKDRAAIVRKAFVDTLSDADFLADAKKSKLGVDPMTGEELEKTVQRLFKLSPAVVAKLRTVLTK
ncbi:MAG TPA: tripartite tricarboxylate transporter substrate-binding protein [candidate division Zixibacteria bacterium]|nr:tripartite tricarboxylate transporter substrate-binding protein [candidate division Zixibacteria bacterium]